MLTKLSLVLILTIIMASSKATEVFRQPVAGEQLIKATNSFAWDLFNKLSKDNKGQNLFLSPASISIALGMTYLGAKNKTMTQMAETLHFNDVIPAHLHSSLADLRIAYNNTNDEYILHTANRLYGQTGYEFLQDFLDSTRLNYDAELVSVNFAESAKTTQEINSWVESQTANKIKDLIPSGVLNAMTRLVLVNAIYFKGDWLNKFDKAKTKEADFFTGDSKTVKVQMMHHNRDFNFGYSKDLKAKALELPYKGDKLSMVVLLPDEKNGLDNLEKSLTAEHMNSLQKTFRMHEVKTVVSLPKFKLEAGFSLKKTLGQMGMSDLFDANKADLSAIDGKGLLFVSEVVHKAFINVDEEGSEAAAATGVIMMLRAMPMRMEFIADHPFLFLIRENTTGSILFLGRMVEPPEAAASSGDKSEL